MLGLAGLTTSLRVAGHTSTSMSSIGTAPSSTLIRSRCCTAGASSRHRMAGAGGRQPSATSNAVTLRRSRLNSTPIRWIGSPRPRYFAA